MPISIFDPDIFDPEIYDCGVACDYLAEGGCVCGGEADCEIHKAPGQSVFSGGGKPVSIYGVGPKLRIIVRESFREYDAEGGCVCGGEAVVSIGRIDHSDFSDEEIVMMLMMASQASNQKVVF